MAYKSLKAINLPFDLVRAEDINKGCLEGYRMLFVPGGWASNKLKALGERGIKEIKSFVCEGGNYFGICGGAGLATLDGIGLLHIKRKPTKERVPSFSGRIKLNISEHPIFSNMQPQKSTVTTQQPTEIISKQSVVISGQSIERTRNTDTDNGICLQPSVLSLSSAFSLQPIFYAWWPSQFVVSNNDIKVIATFDEPLPDSFSSDLNVEDVEANGGWKELETFYGINLDPKRLIGEPAVVEGHYGKGKVFLSLIHFDTPDDRNSAHVLKNIWHYLSQQSEINSHKKSLVNSYQSTVNRTDRDNEIHHFSLLPISLSLMREVEELINFGIRNFLWYWRTPMLLQWRRGVRGLEYCTLYVMIKEIVEILNTKKEVQNIDLDLNSIKEQLTSFIEKSKNLLILERYAMHYEHITYEKCFDPKIQQMRLELFGNSKSHGGFFKLLIDKIDAILFRLLDS
jgi:glutamine amidotransferase-like uncharacterized protein